MLGWKWRPVTRLSSTPFRTLVTVTRATFHFPEAGRRWSRLPAQKDIYETAEAAKTERYTLRLGDWSNKNVAATLVMSHLLPNKIL
jgi:hypothetical protein